MHTFNEGYYNFALNLVIFVVVGYLASVIRSMQLAKKEKEALGRKRAQEMKSYLEAKMPNLSVLYEPKFHNFYVLNRDTEEFVTQAENFESAYNVLNEKFIAYHMDVETEETREALRAERDEILTRKGLHA